ncbi:uncharacterized protein LOC115669515 [Syzygium oleosum]|uniref:uncharacterized protein LOC115669515 n=1 Tax=Syzygium oleosum TaxID=219896 RepID=UPI0024BAF521|nr:uncharacterized protein LOC115669515 [Syzygium oleosum]
MDSPSSHEFDSVKAEKAKAMRRYRRSRKLKTLAHALEVLAALLLLSWYSSGLSAAAGGFLRRLASLLAKPLVVFLISNGIIGVILFLAGKNDDRGHRHEPSHIYEEYLSARRAPGGGYLGTMAAPDETHVDKQIVPYEAPPAHEKIIREVPLPAPEPDPLPSTVVPAVEKGAAEGELGPGAAPPARPAAAAEKRYRRTRSEVTGGEEEEEEEEEGKPRAELRRSATDNGRPRPPSVEDLSNEEFNLTVEKYIAKTKWFHREEIMAEEDAAVLGFRSVAARS